MIGNSRPLAVVNVSFSRPVSFSHTCRARGVALEDPVIDRPGLLAAPPRDDLDLDAVLLNVRARREEDAAARHQCRSCTARAGRRASSSPEPRRAASTSRPAPCSRRPGAATEFFCACSNCLAASPHENQPTGEYRLDRWKPAVLPSPLARSRATAPRGSIHCFWWLLNLLAAVLANVNRLLRFALRPPELRELQNLELAADRARHPVAAAGRSPRTPPRSGSCR